MLPTDRMGLINGSLRPLAPIIFTGAFFSGSGAVTAATDGALAGFALTIVPFAGAMPLPAAARLAPTTFVVVFTLVLPAFGSVFFDDNVPVATGALLPVAPPLVAATPFTDEAGADATGACLEVLGAPVALTGAGTLVLLVAGAVLEGFEGLAWGLAVVGAFAVVAVPAVFVVPFVFVVAVVWATAFGLPDVVAVVLVEDFAGPPAVPVAPAEFPDFAPLPAAVAGVLVALLELLAAFAVEEVVFFDDAAGEADGDGLAVALDELGLFCAAATTVTADASARI